MNDEYLPEMEKRPYVTVTNCRDVIPGGFCDIILEFTFKDPENIGRLVKNIEFRKITTRLKKKFITNYTNRIQKSTEWFREPQWFTH